MTAIPLLVNSNTGVVHQPSCIHARGCIPWVGFQMTPSDKACQVCGPDLGEGR